MIKEVCSVRRYSFQKQTKLFLHAQTCYSESIFQGIGCLYVTFWVFFHCVLLQSPAEALFPLSAPSVVVKAKENHFVTFVKSPKLLPFLGAVKVDICVQMEHRAGIRKTHAFPSRGPRRD